MYPVAMTYQNPQVNSIVTAGERSQTSVPSPVAYHRQNVVSMLHSGHNVCSFAQYVKKLLDSLGRAENYFRLRRKGGYDEYNTGLPRGLVAG